MVVDPTTTIISNFSRSSLLEVLVARVVRNKESGGGRKRSATVVTQVIDDRGESLVVEFFLCSDASIYI
jgi:hypothetical protein